MVKYTPTILTDLTSPETTLDERGCSFFLTTTINLLEIACRKGSKNQTGNDSGVAALRGVCNLSYDVRNRSSPYCIVNAIRKSAPDQAYSNPITPIWAHCIIGPSISIWNIEKGPSPEPFLVARGCLDPVAALADGITTVDNECAATALKVSCAAALEGKVGGVFGSRWRG